MNDTRNDDTPTESMATSTTGSEIDSSGAGSSADLYVRARLREEVSARLASRRIIDVATTEPDGLYTRYETGISDTPQLEMPVQGLRAGTQTRKGVVVTEITVELDLSRNEMDHVSTDPGVASKIRAAAVAAASIEDRLVLVGNAKTSVRGIVPKSTDASVASSAVPAAVRKSIGTLQTLHAVIDAKVVVPRSLIQTLKGGGAPTTEWNKLVEEFKLEVVYTECEHLVVLFSKPGSATLYPVEEWTLTSRTNDGIRTYVMNAAVAVAHDSSIVACEIPFDGASDLSGV